MTSPIQRYCRACDEALSPDATSCPFCTGPTIDYEQHLEEQWQRQQEDAMSEPGPTLAEQHTAAWEEKQRAKGRSF